MRIPDSYNYIGAFLTFACQLKCYYCINHEKGFSPKYKIVPGKDWIRFFNSIETREDLPITLQGGEPTLHPDFYEIVNGIDKHINIDMLTNCQFNINKFCHNVKPERMKRNAPYASIRVSYHPPTMDLDDTVFRVKKLLKRGYSVGVWIVENPFDPYIRAYQKVFLNNGIDCRLKEYLDGKKYGTYKYLEMQGKRHVMCKPSEILISPSGDLHRCHGDLYGNRCGYGSIFSDIEKLPDNFLECSKALCSSCDIKIKTNRFQQGGHCAVEIKKI